MENREKIKDTINKYTIPHALARPRIKTMANLTNPLKTFKASVTAEIQVLADDPNFLAGFIYNFAITSTLNVVFGDISPAEKQQKATEALQDDEFCKELVENIDKIIEGR